MIRTAAVTPNARRLNISLANKFKYFEQFPKRVNKNQSNNVGEDFSSS